MPILALTLVLMIGFLALAIDVGLLMIAKSQAQQAADVAALTAARTINGNSSNNYNESAATTNAQNVLTYNTVLGQSIKSSQLQLSYGSYDYNATTQTFSANFPATSGQSYTAVAATVTSSGSKSAFSSVWGSSLLPAVSSTAQAVHRPRDIALTIDLSGSMRLGTELGFDYATATRATNNPDPLYPTFAQYSSSSAVMQSGTSIQTSSTGYQVPPTNSTYANSTYAMTYVNSFYQNAAYATTLIRAFDSYTSTNGGTTWVAPTSGTPQLPPSSYASVPGGDVPLSVWWSTATYTFDVKDVVGTTSRYPAWELDGYSNCTSGTWTNATSGKSNYTTTPFYGYTQGPGYYGKTFFIWPPDPRRPLSTGTATSWSTTANDTATIRQFLNDDGYGFTTDLANSAFTTTLSSAITSTTATSITVNSATPFPVSGSFSILINSEILLVTAGNGGKTWTVTRGTQGTAGATHTSGTTVALMTAPPLSGIYTAANTSVSPGKTPSTSQTWPWPNDGGVTLSSYLTKNVYAPYTTSSTARFLQTTDTAYQQIMRLYNWNYVIDNLGTTPCDWRIRFFGTNDNTKLFNTSTGYLNVPSSSTYTINYNEILRWLATSPSPFPTQMRSGRVKYYGSIPTAITGSWPSYGSTDQEFWVRVIDYTLGFWQQTAGVYTDVSAMVGYGADFTWGTNQITAPPSATQYMNYLDNPDRPLLRHWFGPLHMVDSLHNDNFDHQQIGNYVWNTPGDTYEAPSYVTKQGFLAAISTLQANHPNDWVTIVPYTEARQSATDTGNRFNNVSCPLGTNYAYASAAMLFPFSTINADGSSNGTEITPFDADPATGLVPSANFLDTPRPHGGTCFAMALMLAYNQFVATPPSDGTLRNFVSSSPITFPSGMAGGMGRKGAQKVIIFETDGLADCAATVTPVSNGNYSYYPIRYDMNNPTESEYPQNYLTTTGNSYVLSQIYSLVQQVASDFGTTRNPFRLYAMAFGPVFSSSQASSGLTTLQTMQYYAGTQSSPNTALSSSQIITGTDARMSSALSTAYTSIFENGVQIALIK